MARPSRRRLLTAAGVAAVVGLGASAYLARAPIREAFHGSWLETRLRLAKRQVEALQRRAPECSAERTLPAIDVILLAVDTLRADHLGFLGYERDVSPHLDALARESLVFERAIAAAPWTTPSFAAVFTGVHPGAMGFGAAIREPVPIPSEAVTIAEILCQAGWQTSGVVSHTFVGQRYGFDRGFEHWDESNAGGATFVSSPDVSARAIASVDRLTERKRPFFLFVHYFDPHYDFTEHPDFRFSSGYGGRVRSEGDNIQRLRALARRGELTERDLRHLLDSYDSEIAFTDHHIGRLLQHLKQRGVYDDALVVFLADHGEAFAERSDRWIGHGLHVYDTVVHVPLMVKLPRQERVGRIARPVGTAEVAATILDVLEHPPVLPGRSLLDASDPPRPVIAQAWAGGTKEAVFEGRWKLIRNERTRKRELFEIDRDPAERRNLANVHRDVVHRLEMVLDAWRRDQAEQARAFSKPAAPDLSEEDEARLRGLGYLE